MPTAKSARRYRHLRALAGRVPQTTLRQYAGRGGALLTPARVEEIREKLAPSIAPPAPAELSASTRGRRFSAWAPPLGSAISFSQETSRKAEEKTCVRIILGIRAESVKKGFHEKSVQLHHSVFYENLKQKGLMKTSILPYCRSRPSHTGCTAG